MTKMSRFIKNSHASKLAEEHISQKTVYTTIAISKDKKERLERLRILKSLHGEELNQKNILEIAIDKYIEQELKSLPKALADMFRSAE